MEKKLNAWREKHGLTKAIQQFNGLWLEFEDESGGGICQPDVLLIAKDRVIVVECKLTQTDGAEEQLSGLYMPIVELLWDRPVRGVQVCRNMYQRPKNPILHPRELFEKELLDVDLISTLHWTI